MILPQISGGCKASRTHQQSDSSQPQFAKCLVVDPHDAGKNLPTEFRFQRSKGFEHLNRFIVTGSSLRATAPPVCYFFEAGNRKLSTWSSLGSLNIEAIPPQSFGDSSGLDEPQKLLCGLLIL